MKYLTTNAADETDFSSILWPIHRNTFADELADDGSQLAACNYTASIASLFPDLGCASAYPISQLFAPTHKGMVLTLQSAELMIAGATKFAWMRHSKQFGYGHAGSPLRAPQRDN